MYSFYVIYPVVTINKLMDPLSKACTLITNSIRIRVKLSVLNTFIKFTVK